MAADRGAAAGLAELPQAEVLVQYLEEPGPALPEHAPFAVEGEPAPGGSRRPYLIEVRVMVQHKTLRADWAWSRSAFRRTAIERLAGDFTEALRGLIDHCLSPQAGGYTPSDFPLMELDQDGLSELMTQIEGSE